MRDRARLERLSGTSRPARPRRWAACSRRSPRTRPRAPGRSPCQMPVRFGDPTRRRSCARPRDGVVVAARERLEMLERPPVLDDRRQAHLVREQSLVRMLREVLEHVPHAPPSAQVAEAPNRVPQLEAGADQEHHEVTVDLGRMAAGQAVGHQPPFGRGRAPGGSLAPRPAVTLPPVTDGAEIRRPPFAVPQGLPGRRGLSLGRRAEAFTTRADLRYSPRGGALRHFPVRPAV